MDIVGNHTRIIQPRLEILEKISIDDLIELRELNILKVDAINLKFHES